MFEVIPSDLISILQRSLEWQTGDRVHTIHLSSFFQDDGGDLGVENVAAARCREHGGIPQKSIVGGALKPELVDLHLVLSIGLVEAVDGSLGVLR